MAYYISIYDSLFLDEAVNDGDRYRVGLDDLVDDRTLRVGAREAAVGQVQRGDDVGQRGLLRDEEVDAAVAQVDEVRARVGLVDDAYHRAQPLGAQEHGVVDEGRAHEPVAVGLLLCQIFGGDGNR